MLGIFHFVLKKSFQNEISQPKIILDTLYKGMVDIYRRLPLRSPELFQLILHSFNIQLHKRRHHFVALLECYRLDSSQLEYSRRDLIYVDVGVNGEMQYLSVARPCYYIIHHS